jgi:hypothetical protein
MSLLTYAGTIDPNTPDSKYIEYGSKFKCILKLCGKDVNNKYFCASAVAIKPRWILTAAHIGQGCKSCIVHIEEKPICVEKIIYHEKYKENVFGEYDLALGYLEKDLGLDFYPELYEKDDEVGKICCMSGFGLGGNFRTGASRFDGHRRAGSNIIEHIDRKLLICTPSMRHKTSLEFIICSGDSGGGLFIDNKLAGINSCVIAADGKPDSTYGDESGHTRVSLYIDWIKRNISEEEGARANEK